MQDMEKEDVKERRQDFRETSKPPREESPPEEPAFGQGVPRISQEGLPEDPVSRLATILDVHGVDTNTRNQLLGIFQLHPGYKENPMQLHYLLTSKLPRRYHATIPMMVQSFNAQEGSYPEGVPMGMMGGYGQPQVPPYAYGMQPQGYLSQFMPPYTYMPYPRGPMGNRQEEDTEERPSRGRERSDPMSSMKDMFAMMGTMLEFMNNAGRSKSEETQNLNETLRSSYEGLRGTLEEVMEKARDEREEMRGVHRKEMDEIKETSRLQAEAVKDMFHESEKGRLEDKVARLEGDRDEERSTGLGELVREAGEGVNTQIQGIRESMDKGADKIGDIISKVGVPGGPQSSAIAEETGSGPKKRTVGQASDLMKAGEEVERLAKEAEIGG